MCFMLRAVAALIVVVLPAVAAADIDRLGWLAGCWAYDGAEPGSGEHWTGPAGGTMFATSRTIRNGKTIAFEYLRIEEDSTGRLQLVASPSGQATTTFSLLRLEDGEVAFENPQHDFPQRIIYKLDGADRLLGRIEGDRDGKISRVEFPMSRVACDPPSS